MTEAHLVHQILTYINALPDGWAVKYHGDMYSTNGVPDILACVNGQFIAIECKVPGKMPTPLQALTMEKIREAGGQTFWFDSLDRFFLIWERFIGAIDETAQAAARGKR